MPFLFIGILLIVGGLLLGREAKKSHDHNGESGAGHLIFAGLVLVVLFGLLSRLAISST